MTNSSLKTKLISLVVTIALLVCTLPLTSIIGVAETLGTITLSADNVEIPYAKSGDIAGYLKENITVSYSEGGEVPKEDITVSVDLSECKATFSVPGREDVTVTYTLGEMILIGFEVAIHSPLDVSFEELNETIVKDHIDVLARYEYDNENGFVLFRVEDDEYNVVKTDDESILVVYNGFAAVVMYNEVERPVLTTDEPLELKLFHFEEKTVYVNFIPEEDGNYLFRSISEDSDPKMEIFTADGEYLGYSDDFGGGDLDFYLAVSDLVAGEKYYLKLNDFHDESIATVSVKKLCDTHTPVEDTCFGTYCSVCEEYYGYPVDHSYGEELTCIGYLCKWCGYSDYGEIGDHATDSEQTCYGYLCKWCNEYYGEGGDHATDSEQTCYGYLCKWCGGYYGEGADHETESEQTCDGYLCKWCGSYYGEGVDHETESEQTCDGYLCKWCGSYYGEKLDHVSDGTEPDCLGYSCYYCGEKFGDSAYPHADDDENGRCDVCDTSILESEMTLTEGDNIIEFDYFQVYADFTPTSSGEYYIRFSGINVHETMCVVYDECYRYMDAFTNMDYPGAYIGIELEAGKQYYFNIVSFAYEVTVEIGRVCERHTPAGDVTCLGTLCSVCGIYYGDLGDHVVPYEYDNISHYGSCVTCDEYFYGEHDFDNDDGVCECGYFEHECEFDAYDYTLSEHCVACSICGIADEFNAEYHDYNEEGICICGREILKNGIYLGTTLVGNGEYMDNEGNVTSTRPGGGYAYYEDGKLTLSSFTLINYEENIFGEASAIYHEGSLEIILIGESYLETLGDDNVYIACGDLTVKGNGSLAIETQMKMGYYGSGSYGDGIDVNGGDLTVESGKLFINASNECIEVSGGDVIINGGALKLDSDDEDGIDVKGNVIINGGSIIIYSDDDDGIEVDNGGITVNGGTIDISAYENGIVADGDFVMNGGSIDVLANDYDYETNIGVWITGDVIISGGVINIDSGEHGIFSESSIEISGGALYIEITSDEVGAGISAMCGIEIINAPDGVEVVYDDYNDIWTVAVDDANMIFNFGIGENADKKLISDYVIMDNIYVYTGEEITVAVNVGTEHYGELTEGVDYTVSVIGGDKILDVGKYIVVITGIGDYIGEYARVVEVIKAYELDLYEEVEFDLDAYDKPTAIFKFTPEHSGTYSFNLDSNMRFAMINVLIDSSYKLLSHNIENVELVGGETYYISITIVVARDRDAKLSVDVICNDHFGGEATYTEKAVCDRCGESYGEVLPCPGHVGGEATYTERAICEECGFEYGDMLVCDHMCHADGLLGIIWKIFDFFYDLLGIESECKCGADH